MMDRPGFRRDWGNGLVAHKGIYDRKGRHFVFPYDCEEWIVEEFCGGCLVSLYTMSMGKLTERYLQWKTKTSAGRGV